MKKRDLKSIVKNQKKGWANACKIANKARRDLVEKDEIIKELQQSYDDLKLRSDLSIRKNCELDAQLDRCKRYFRKVAFMRENHERLMVETTEIIEMFSELDNQG